MIRKAPVRVALRVTTATCGVREVEWVGRYAERTAAFYSGLWRREGHKVERFTPTLSAKKSRGASISPLRLERRAIV